MTRLGLGVAGVLIATAVGPSRALVQQTQVIAQCLEWKGDSCVFLPMDPVDFPGLKLTQQTVCKVCSNCEAEQDEN